MRPYSGGGSGGNRDKGNFRGAENGGRRWRRRDGMEASEGRKGEMKARGRGGVGGTTCMYLLFYETSNKCGAVSVIGSTLLLSGALLRPLWSAPEHFCRAICLPLISSWQSSQQAAAEWREPAPGHKASPRSSPEALFQRTQWILFFLFIYLFIYFFGQGQAETSTGRQAVRHRCSSNGLCDACPCEMTCGLGCFCRLRPLLNISLVRGEAGMMRGLNPSVGLLSEPSIHTQQECIHTKLSLYQNTFPVSLWCTILFPGQMMIFNLTKILCLASLHWWCLMKMHKGSFTCVRYVAQQWLSLKMEVNFNMKRIMKMSKVLFLSTVWISPYRCRTSPHHISQGKKTGTILLFTQLKCHFILWR